MSAYNPTHHCWETFIAFIFLAQCLQLSVCVSSPVCLDIVWSFPPMWPLSHLYLLFFFCLISTNISLRAITWRVVVQLKMKCCSRRGKYRRKMSFLSNVGCFFGKKWSGMCFIEDNLQVTQQTADWDESSAAEVWAQTVRHKYGGRIYGLLSWRKCPSPTECNQHTFVGKHTSSDMKKLEGKF